jgi:hypothetical protein
VASHVQGIALGWQDKCRLAPWMLYCVNIQVLVRHGLMYEGLCTLLPHWSICSPEFLLMGDGMLLTTQEVECCAAMCQVVPSARHVAGCSNRPVRPDRSASTGCEWPWSTATGCTVLQFPGTWRQLQQQQYMMRTTPVNCFPYMHLPALAKALDSSTISCFNM